MEHSNQWLVTILIIAGLYTTACTKGVESQTTTDVGPADVVPVQGTDLSRVTLTAKAMERIDLKTDQIREQSVSRSASARKVIPYSSLIYGTHGQTWVYTSPKPGTFVRHKVDVDYIEGDLVVLNAGPPTGTVVASVGVAELYGAEFHVGK
jgi:hypothetical protein